MRQHGLQYTRFSSEMPKIYASSLILIVPFIGVPLTLDAIIYFYLPVYIDVSL